MNILSNQHENNFSEINLFCLEVIPLAKILPRQMQKIQVLARQLRTAEVNFAGWVEKLIRV